jgi:hypothetical protein
VHPDPSWRLEFSSDVIEAQSAPNGPVAAALGWVEQILDGRLGEAWFSTGALFRLALTRHWCWRHRFALHRAGHDPLELATALADDDGPGHPMWPAFARGQQPPADRSAAGWVATGPPEPVGPDLEVVELIPADVVGTGDPAPPLTLLLRLTPTGWRVAGHGRTPCQAGWPPCQ